jgi:large subunit ribosomal protein L25
MSNPFALNAEARADAGKGASRRLRHQARVPGIIYGGESEPAMISIETRELVKALENETFYSSILTLNVDGKKEQAVIRDLQRHPSKGFPLHADFMRISKGHKITIIIPVHFLNEEKCSGVKDEGGEIHRNLAEVEVSCLPKDLPDAIEVDMIDVALNQIVHLSDLKLPKGVELVQLLNEHDLPVVAVRAKRTAAATDDATDSEGESEGGEEADA